MSRVRGVVVAAVGVLPLAVAAAAFAANSVGFTDNTGDAYGGPDISKVTVSSDDAGVVTVRVETDTPVLVLKQGVWLMVDADQNPDTGSVYFGAEWAFQLAWASGIKAYRASGDFFDETAAPPSLTAAFASPTTTFSFKAADLGITSGFNLAVASVNLVGTIADSAPDYRTFNYQLVAGTQPPTVGADTRAPVVFAEKAKAKRGKTVELDYELFDGRGETADTITLYRNGKLVKTFSYRLGDASPWFVYFVKWKVPKTERGKLKFCVRATDRAGNQSAVSCAPIAVS